MTHNHILKLSDCPEYLEAGSLEYLKAVSEKTWQGVDKKDLRPGDSVIPCAVVYSRKRSGAYKARLVVLGNRDKNDYSNLDLYSPTVSF